MRRKIFQLTLSFFIITCIGTSIEMGFAFRSEETTISYSVTTEDVFPGMTDVDAFITSIGIAVFNSSDDIILPNSTTQYYIDAGAESGNLTVDYEIDRPLIKKSGLPSVTFNPDWLVGDSPPITVYEDAVINITVVIHGHIDGHMTVVGNGSTAPSEITWSNWEAKEITVSTNTSAENGQTIQIQTATEYVVYFTVYIELIGIETLTRDSQTKEVSGSPIVEYPIPVVPEFSSLRVMLSVIGITTVMVILFKVKPGQHS